MSSLETFGRAAWHSLLAYDNLLSILQLEEELSMMRAAKRELPRGSNSEDVRIWDRDICLHLVKVTSYIANCKQRRSAKLVRQTGLIKAQTRHNVLAKPAGLAMQNQQVHARHLCFLLQAKQGALIAESVQPYLHIRSVLKGLETILKKTFEVNMKEIPLEQGSLLFHTLHICRIFWLRRSRHFKSSSRPLSHDISTERMDMSSSLFKELSFMH